MDEKQRRLIFETMEIVFETGIIIAKQTLGSKPSQPIPAQKRKRKRKSLIDLCIIILTDEQCPVHIDQMVNLLKMRYERETDRDSLSSALAKKAKAGVLFRRVSPATFELL